MPASITILLHLLRHPMSDSLRSRILDIANGEATPNDDAARKVHQKLLDRLNTGEVRSASRNEDGEWQAHSWVKEGILLGFRLGAMTVYSSGGFSFFDKDTYPLKPVSPGDNVRIVPGGSAIRTGSYVASGVICMPPMYINVGAYVDEGTMVDSHALVGSCAQIGRNVHLSAAVQIGGVLEPVGARPVIIEDDAFIGGGCGIYEGCLVREGAVLAPGVQLTASTRLFDLVNETVIQGEGNSPLEVPEGAVMVPGSRPASGDFAEQHDLQLYAPIIVKYRDRKTAASTVLEDALR